MVAIVLLHFSIELQLELTGIIYLVDPAIRRALQWAKAKAPSQTILLLILLC